MPHEGREGFYLFVIDFPWAPQINNHQTQASNLVTCVRVASETLSAKETGGWGL